MSLPSLKKLKKAGVESTRWVNVSCVAKKMKPDVWSMGSALFAWREKQKLLLMLPYPTFWVLGICEIFHNNDTEFNLMTAYQWWELNDSTWRWKKWNMSLLKMLGRSTISTTKVKSQNMTIPENAKKPLRVLLILALQQKAMNCLQNAWFLSLIPTLKFWKHWLKLKRVSFPTSFSQWSCKVCAPCCLKKQQWTSYKALTTQKLSR